MIKIVHAAHLRDYVIQVEFSDGSSGEYDLGPLVVRDTVLTRPPRTPEYLKRFFLELGSLCWPNGLELSAEAIRRRLEEGGKLRRARVA